MKEGQRASGEALEALEATRKELQWLTERLSAMRAELRACTQELEEAKETKRRIHQQQPPRCEERLQTSPPDHAAAQERRKNYAPLLAVLSRELQNPLISMQRALDGLRSQMEPLDAGLGEWVATLARDLEHLCGLGNELEDASQLMDGRMSLKKTKLRIDQAVINAVRAFDRLLAERGHSLALSLPNDSAWVEGDAMRLEQIVGNLIRNAAMQMEQGGHIWLTAECEGGQFVLKVRDSGRGLTKARQQSVFDLFNEGEEASKPPHGTLRLGLAAVQKLVRMHGGSVNVFSAGPGRGSEFTVRLPVVDDKPEESAPATPNFGKSRGTKQRILVVEDHNDVADALAMLLRAKGYDVWVSPDGEAALEAAQRFQPGVAFVDIGLPKMDGYEVARQLRATYSIEQLLLVALTAYGQREDVQRAYQAGFDHHLLKPAKLVDIQGLIQTRQGAGVGTSSEAKSE